MGHFLLLAALAAFAHASPSSSLHPRPEWKEVASYARWLVHESDYAVISTHSAAEPSGVFGNIISISDGEGYEDSTGIIYTYIPDLDATYKDLMADDRVALTFTEMALAGGQSGGCANHTAENPPCGRFTISGRLTRVPADKEQIALKYLYSRHPEMQDWGKQHHFKPFWIAKENITGFFVIDMFGGATPVNTSEYLAAPWYRHNIVPDSYVCSVCGHTYDPEKDGGGKSFEDLPDTWTCPVCGQPKSAYKKQAPSAAAATYQFSVCQHVYDPEKDGGGKPFEDLPATWTCPVCGQPKSSYKKTMEADGSVAWVHV